MASPSVWRGCPGDVLRAIEIALDAHLAAGRLYAVAPLQQPETSVIQIAVGCGPGRTRVGGVCVARTTKRQVRTRRARFGEQALALAGIEIWRALHDAFFSPNYRR